MKHSKDPFEAAIEEEQEESPPESPVGGGGGGDGSEEGRTEIDQTPEEDERAVDVRRPVKKAKTSVVVAEANMEAELTKYPTSADPAKMAKMQTILSQFTEDQMSSYESFRRSALQRPQMKKLLIGVTGSQKISMPMIIVACGTLEGFIMDRIVHESEEIQARKKRKRMRNFKSDIDIMMLVLSIIAKVQYSVRQIPRQIRKPATRIGHEYIQRALVGEERDTFRRLYRMDPEAFLKLCSIFRKEMGLKDTRYVSVEEMLAIFLFIVGQNSRYISVEDRFQRSRFSISTSFNTILKALKALAPKYMAKPGLAVPTKIKDSTRFYPYFKDCVGAIDGTHIPTMITGQDTSSYRNRKGQLSQNVLAACNFDLEFTYVLSGWEGSAHDAKVLNDALSRNTNKLIVPEGKYYLVDCGFANRRQFLAPFRSTRYHLQDFRGQGKDPVTANELFNHRHSSLRNVVERIFGIFKSRFLIFKYAPPFPYKTQVELVLACVVLHNYLRRECRSDLFEDVRNAEGTDTDERVDDGNNEEEQIHGTQEQQRLLANNWRATLAENMWTDAMNMGS